MKEKTQKLKKKNLIAPCVSALLMALAFSRGNLGILAWFGLVPLFLELKGKTRRQRWLLFFVFAFLFFLGTLYWIIHVSLAGLIALSLFLAFEFSFFGLLMPASRNTRSLLILPLLWIAFERLRGFLFFGFGWGILGYTQFRNLPLIQIAQYGGVWAISYLLVLSNICIMRAVLDDYRISLKKSYIFIPLVCLIFVYGFGYYSLGEKFTNPQISISLIQANIPQEQKWDPDYSKEIIETFSSLSKKAAKEKPLLVIWPETSVPGYLLDEARLYLKITNLAKELSSYLLVGSPREDYVKKKFFNTAFLFDPSGHLRLFHDKIHLVPFGEYIPYKNLFPFLIDSPIADFSAGESYTLFELKTNKDELVRFGVLICFEDVFPGLVRNFRAKGADFMVTITNEAWFKHSSEPIQHTAISVFRAVENRCWFLRCANTGISCFIDPYGRIKNKISENKRDIFIKGISTMNLGY